MIYIYFFKINMNRIYLGVTPLKTKVWNFVSSDLVLLRSLFTLNLIVLNFISPELYYSWTLLVLNFIWSWIFLYWFCFDIDFFFSFFWYWYSFDLDFFRSWFFFLILIFFDLDFFDIDFFLFSFFLSKLDFNAKISVLKDLW